MENKLSEGWEWKKLGEIGDYINGKAFKPSEWAETGKPIVRIQNLTDPSKPFNCFEGECEEKYLLKNGDILISWSASLGVFLWEGGDALLNQHIFKAIPEEKIIDKRYFVYVVKTVIEKMGSLTHGSTMKHIVKSDFNDTKIPVPPLETQQKIVSILEKAEETKKLRAQADELTQQLLQSVFLEMFGDLETNPKGWVVNGFDHFAKIDTKMIKDFTAYENKPHIGIENIEKDTGNLINYKEVGAQNLTSGKYLFTKNHIIYSKIRPNLNKVALPDFDGLCSADAYPLLVNNKYTNRYFFAYILRSKYFLDNILKLSDRTNIPKVNKDQLRSFECICPPIELQNKFAELVEHVEKTKISQQQSSIEINNLFDALMQKAFTGELIS